MRQEVLDFYTLKKIPVNRMVDVGIRKGLTADGVREAATEVFDEIQNGLKIDDIRISWRVYERARGRVVPVDRESAMRELSKSVADLHGKLDRHMTPWYKKLWRYLNGN